MCPVCQGRGEVAAGITTGTKESPPYYPDSKGRMIGRLEPTGYAVNPDALIYSKLLKKHEYWLLETNPFGDLWGIAICGRCRGSGLAPE